MGWKDIDNMHPNGVIVRKALDDAGVSGQIVETLESSPTAVRAAEQLGVGVGQIANSLVFPPTDLPCSSSPLDRTKLTWTSLQNSLAQRQFKDLMRISFVNTRANPSAALRHSVTQSD
jgi:hypothetical protein